MLAVVIEHRLSTIGICPIAEQTSSLYNARHAINTVVRSGAFGRVDRLRLHRHLAILLVLDI